MEKNTKTLTTKKIQAIRGMNDILPEEIPYWQQVERALNKVMASYGYLEIRLPLVEHTELFVRTIGEITDIVEKEMYTFFDRNEESISLRPEATAGCVRAGIEHGLLHNQKQRFWYLGPMFRRERPQKGRYRQFHQCGVEAFGFAGPDIDAELLLLGTRIWRLLGIEDKLTLEINSLGSEASRAHYREVLIDYFKKNYALLDADAQRRLATNPLRILDSKNPVMQDLLQNAPKILDYLDAESKEHFVGLCQLLDAAQVKYEINPRLVRGLDYYCLTVFEWTTTELGSQGAVCAGGHYNNLVASLGGKDTPAIGFAIGLERLVLLAKNSLKAKKAVDAYLVLVGEKALSKGFALAEELRTTLPSLHLVTNCGDGNFSQQLKRADQSGAKLALILADEEIAANLVQVKYLREDKPQEKIKLNELAAVLERYLLL